MNGEVIGNISGFETLGLLDGPGVRFVVFLQGCPLRCSFCHNPEMWNPNEIKDQLSPRELVDKVKKYKRYFKDGGGITISGGEPLMQVEFVKETFKLCKQEGIHTCLDTSGHGDNFEELLNFCDLVILDVKELDQNKYKKLAGKSIEKFFNFLKICQQKGIPLWLRQVIIPNFNDTEKDVLKLKKFADGLKNVEKIELLPYHRMAEEKYTKLGIKYRLKDVSEMDKEKCKTLENLLSNKSL